ncbi:unnamed protein product [Adineta steineri]|uniref:RRM domain-containing protein n=1 Tax=Adineta steineri TaxID=433720 RepID=A0A813ZFK8_9BILA|nr:unnamed protein product [Adineta steineri]
MSSNLGKKLLFTNLSYKTTEVILMNYFSTYGYIEELYLYKDDQDQSLRKGFIIYKDIHSVNSLMSKRPHFIDIRQIHIQRAIPNHNRNNTNNLSEQLGINLTVTEIFISRLCSGEKRDMFVNYFQSFGNIIDCRVFNSYSQNSKQTGYAFIRFMDYDSVDQIILSRPHVINSRYYHIRKCIPREYNYIISSIKPISQNKPNWRHFSFGLINMKTQEITYPSLRDDKPQSSTNNDFILLDPPMLTVSVDRTPTNKCSTNEFELITTNSLSSSSISIINSNDDDFTPLASPLYSTAIAYSPTTYDNEDKNIYELI